MQYKLHQYLRTFSFVNAQFGFTQIELLLVILLAGVIPTVITGAISLNRTNHTSPRLSQPSI
jgi:hypothetical protein